MREVELKMTRLRSLQKRQVNGERFVIGAMMIDAAREDPLARDTLLMVIDRAEMREMDRRRIEPLVEELRKLPGVLD